MGLERAIGRSSSSSRLSTHNVLEPDSVTAYVCPPQPVRVSIQSLMLLTIERIQTARGAGTQQIATTKAISSLLAKSCCFKYQMTRYQRFGASWRLSGVQWEWKHGAG